MEAHAARAYRARGPAHVQIFAMQAMAGGRERSAPGPGCHVDRHLLADDCALRKESHRHALASELPGRRPRSAEQARTRRRKARTSRGTLSAMYFLKEAWPSRPLAWPVAMPVAMPMGTHTAMPW